MNKRIFLSEDKYFDIDTKEIKPQETIFLTFDPDKIDIDEACSYMKAMAEIFPKNNIIVRPIEIDITTHE